MYLPVIHYIIVVWRLFFHDIVKMIWLGVYVRDSDIFCNSNRSFPAICDEHMEKIWRQQPAKEIESVSEWARVSEREPVNERKRDRRAMVIKWIGEK